MLTPVKIRRPGSRTFEIQAPRELMKEYKQEKSVIDRDQTKQQPQQPPLFTAYVFIHIFAEWGGGGGGGGGGGRRAWVLGEYFSKV